MTPLWQEITSQISSASGEPFDIRARHSQGGGCINQAFVLQGKSSHWFVKLNSSDRLDMFTAEAEGLKALDKPGAIRVPRPLVWGASHGYSYLVMEHVPMVGHLNPEQFGRQLATLHQCWQPYFGWQRDNTIGATPQENTPGDKWAEFWRVHRLEFQLELARSNGAPPSLLDKGMKLASQTARFFISHSPRASVLHGDLWSGNWGADTHDNPVIFDPAVYFGDHETDLAMMLLFGNPGEAFFAGYREVYPIDSGFAIRKTFYNLYHILNHFNLFGGGYAHQAEGMIDRLLSEL